LILVNGRELDEHGLRARVKARRERALYPEAMLRLLDKELLEILREKPASSSLALYGLRRALDEEDEERDRRNMEGGRWRRLFSRSGPGPEAGTVDTAPRGAGGEEGEPSGPRDQRQQEEKKPTLRRLLAFVLTMRIVQGVGEGYFQQQKKFNIFATRELEIIHRLLQSGGRGGPYGAKGRRGLWITPRPAWGPEMVEYAASLCGKGAVLVGIPGPELIQALWERGLAVLAVDGHDRAVAEVQSRFYPAVLHPHPLELLRNTPLGEADLLLISFPECLGESELEELLRWAGNKMDESARVLVGLNDWSASPHPHEDGFVRFWPVEFLRALLEKEGFAASERREAGAAFLLGEKRDEK